MSLSIAETLHRLPPRIQDLTIEAIALSVDALQLEYVDSSAYMLAITRLGDSDASSKWLRSIGITQRTIARIMTAHFNRREGDEVMIIASAQSGKDTFTTELKFTEAAEKMFDTLMMSLRRPTNGTMSSLFVTDLLAAVVLSGSSTVKQVFHSVGHSMAQVHEELDISRYAIS
jgi:hypothetical protein